MMRGFVDIQKMKIQIRLIGAKWDKIAKGVPVDWPCFKDHKNAPYQKSVPLWCPTMEFVCIHGNKVGQHVP